MKVLSLTLLLLGVTLVNSQDAELLPPSTFDFDALSTSVRLTWIAVEGAIGYQVMHLCC